jgi:hypothetical protein
LLNGMSEITHTAIINIPNIKISLVLIFYIFEQHFLLICFIVLFLSLHLKMFERTITAKIHLIRRW